jgi:hypothetical protein
MTEDKPSALAKVLAEALATEDEQNWSWTRNYNPGLLEHMHALGVIAANYNRLESELRLLLNLFIGDAMYKAHAGNYIFERLSNAQRLDLLKQLYNSAVGGFELAARLDWFVSGYGVCAENRNILMHSETSSDQANALQIASTLELRKYSKNNPGSLNFISLKLSELRNVADDIDRFTQYGLDLAICEIARRSGGKINLAGREIQPSLPDKPPEPIHLTLAPLKDAKDNSLPQKSSEG